MSQLPVHQRSDECISIIYGVVRRPPPFDPDIRISIRTDFGDGSRSIREGGQKGR
jgi:hypothetical protein